MSAAKQQPRELRLQRRLRPHGCWGHLVAAPLWVAYEANLGTLLRTCDAVGACVAVPDSPHYRRCLNIGDTLGPRRRPHTHWARPDRDAWIESMHSSGWRIVALGLADDATPLSRVQPAKYPTVVLVGHEQSGVPDRWVDNADECVYIPAIPDTRAAEFGDVPHLRSGTPRQDLGASLVSAEPRYRRLASDWTGWARDERR